MRKVNVYLDIYPTEIGSVLQSAIISNNFAGRFTAQFSLRKPIPSSIPSCFINTQYKNEDCRELSLHLPAMAKLEYHPLIYIPGFPQRWMHTRFANF